MTKPMQYYHSDGTNFCEIDWKYLPNRDWVYSENSNTIFCKSGVWTKLMKKGSILHLPDGRVRFQFRGKEKPVKEMISE